MGSYRFRPQGFAGEDPPVMECMVMRAPEPGLEGTSAVGDLTIHIVEAGESPCMAYCGVVGPSWNGWLLLPMDEAGARSWCRSCLASLAAACLRSGS